MAKNIKSKILIIIILTTLFFAGCSSSNYLGMHEYLSTKNIKASYLFFKGANGKCINLKAGDEINLNIKITTRKGTLKVTFSDKDGNKLFEVENPDKIINKTIKIKKNSTYIIKAEGKHSGSYDISWDIKHSQK